MFASARGLMSSSFAILVVVTFVWLQCGARAMPAADEDRYIDKEVRNVACQSLTI